MKKVSLLVTLIVIFSVVLPQTVFAGTFIFKEEFNSTSKINLSFSRVVIREGRVFTADDASSSRIESKIIKKTSYGITRAVLNSTFMIHATGGDIIYYLSNNN